ATAPGLAVAFALVVLDLDLDVLGLVGQIVGIFDRVVGLGVVGRRLLERGIPHLLCFGQGRLGRSCGGCRCGSGRRRRGAPTAHLHEVFAVVLTAALGAFDRTLVQVVEARRTILAGTLRAPGRLDHSQSPGNSAGRAFRPRRGAYVTRSSPC